MKYSLLSLLVALSLSSPLAAANPSAAEVTEAVAKSPIKGGLCVVLGDIDTKQAGDLANAGFLVHVLTDARASKQNELLHAGGVSGTVTMEAWTEQHLPYMDGLVSLMVVLDTKGILDPELLRAVRPQGELVIWQEGSWRRTIKPRMDGADDWSQWRHGPDRNPVSKDRLVDVPRRVQWLFSSSVVLEAADMVTAAGRVFIQDRDTLLARDAFNGLPLWRAALYPAKKLDIEKLGMKKPPAQMVARGEQVFGLMEDGKFRALDAATGKPLREFPDAGLPYALLLLDDGKLILAADDGLRAFDSMTGVKLWQQPCKTPRNLLAGGGNVYYIEGSDRERDRAATSTVFARNTASGALLWQQTHEWASRTELASYGEDRIVFEVRRPLDWKALWAADPKREKDDRYQLVVIDARTGLEQQRLFGVASSARHGEFCTAFWKNGHLLTEARTPKGIGIARYAPDNLARPVDVFQANFVGDRGWGHCYPPVLTERFYINGQLHFTDLEARSQSGNVITRGACHILRPGYIPANGMIYTFPKHCVCFPLLNGNICLAPATPTEPKASHPLIKGPAFGEVEVKPAEANDWPTFRHDDSRTAGTAAAAPAKLDVLWTKPITGIDYKSGRAAEWSDNPWLGGPVTAPVVANGLVFVAQSDAHRVVAFDATTGEQRWHYFTGGRIDGPPTIHRGLALVGCRDGWVYALRASDGELAWRWRIAPDDRRISTYGQLESAWPCAGSILVSDGLAYVSAGLHPNSDGGVRVACIIPDTGEAVWVRKFDDLGLDSAWPEPHDPRPRDKPSVASDPWRTIRPQEYRHFDLPVRDGNKIAVSRCLFDAKTGAIELRKASGYYEVTAGGAKMPRTSWKYNDVQMQAPLAVSMGTSVFSTSPRKGLLFRTDFTADGKFNTDWVNVPHEQWKAGVSHASSKIYESGFRWAVETGGESASYPRAMIVAGDRLAYAQRDGILILRDIRDGKETLRAKLEPLAWDALAATPGKFFAVTATGNLVCLGAR